MFDKDRTVIGRHIRNIYKEEELVKDITCAKYAYMGIEGDQSYENTAYNFDVIICEENRNEKFRNMENPFKFGTIVEDSFFTDRVREKQYVSEILHSANHLILISPRRYGKSSLVHEVLKKIDRPSISINLQSVTSVHQLAGMIIRHTLSKFPLERIKCFKKKTLFRKSSLHNSPFLHF